jgi:4-hydroxy-3-methylbut-2-enyl diphosphate reductase
MLLEKLENFDLNILKDIVSIGVTASASAPEILVENFIQLIRKKFHIKIHGEDSIKENVFFKIPQQLKKNKLP